MVVRRQEDLAPDLEALVGKSGDIDICHGDLVELNHFPICQDQPPRRYDKVEVREMVRLSMETEVDEQPSSGQHA
ncbi:hypothetical protein CC2G_011340 [Coprinopsis cinerea AmutBmut pab1-1]|nr:hypothetical protein CC2G_011340 [Coprinopsis cinerea AmutBmut pab1-1]